jgi:replicative DNA helicase
MGKIANAGHDQDLPAGRREGRRHDRGAVSGPLAATRPPIINAEDYGRAIYDLALRRSLITIGEDMVNIAFDAPLDMPPQTQIEDAERRLFELAETGRYDGGFQSFPMPLHRTPSTWPARPIERDGSLSGISTGLRDLDPRWAACSAPT